MNEQELGRLIATANQGASTTRTERERIAAAMRAALDSVDSEQAVETDEFVVVQDLVHSSLPRTGARSQRIAILVGLAAALLLVVGVGRSFRSDPSVGIASTGELEGKIGSFDVTIDLPTNRSLGNSTARIVTLIPIDGEAQGGTGAWRDEDLIVSEVASVLDAAAVGVFMEENGISGFDQRVADDANVFDAWTMSISDAEALRRNCVIDEICVPFDDGGEIGLRYGVLNEFDIIAVDDTSTLVVLTVNRSGNKRSVPILSGIEAHPSP